MNISAGSSRDKVIEQIEVTKELKQITESNAKASSKSFWASLCVSIVAIIISISLGIISYNSSRNWQNQQLKALKEQNNLLVEQNKYLNILLSNIKNSFKDLNQQKK